MSTAAIIFLAVTYALTPPKVVIREVPVDKIVIVEKIKPINVFITGTDINAIITVLKEKYPSEYEKVLAAYDFETRDREVTVAIITHSLSNAVPLNLSMGLAKRESGFDPFCVTQNATSTDRGVFQLNSKSFPKWKRADFFNVDKNCQFGIEYLKSLLENSDSQELALASYNAGSWTVQKRQIPYLTSIHVWTIKKYERAFDVTFNVKVLPVLEHVKFQEGRAWVD